MTIQGPRSPRSRRILGVSILSLLSLIAADRAAAQTTFTNTAGGNTWSTAGNWDAGEPTAGVDAILPSSLAGTITLSAGELANTLTINDAYTLNGGDLTVTTGDITVATGVTANIGTTVLQGATGLTKLGAGVLTLGATNTFTGLVEINEGILRISNTSGLGNAANTLTLGTAATTGTLDYTGNTAAIARAIALSTTTAGRGVINVATAGQTLTLSGVISGGLANAPDTATLGSTALTLTGPGRVALTGNNTFTGNLVIDQATLVFTSDSQLGATATNTYKSIILQNGGTFSSTASYNPTSGAPTNNKRFVIGTGGGTLDFASGTTLQLDDANQLSGAGTLTKAGNGVLVLSNQTFNFTGAINVTAGTLRALGNGNILGSGAGVTAPIVVSNGAAYDIQTTVSNARPVTISGSGIGGTGSLLNSGTAAATVGGVVTLAGDVTVGGLNGITLPSLNGGGVARTITKLGTGAFITNGAGANFVGTTVVAITDGEIFLGAQNSLGTNATLTVGGTASAAAGVVQNGAALAGYSYSVLTNGLVGGDKAFLDSLAVGGNLNVLPETLVETVAGALATTSLAIPVDASRFFGIGANLSDSITIGTGTRWKGISNDNLSRTWQTGTITANSDFEIRSTNGKTLILGNSTGGGGVNIVTANPTIATVTGGTLALSDNTPGLTSNLTFQVTSGATLQTTESNALGTSATAANNARVNVLSGGTFNPNAGSTVSGNVTIRQGGILFMDDAANLTGIGTITQEAGAITRVTKDLANSGAQSPGTVAGSIIRIEGSINDLNLNFDDAANYVITGATRGVGSFTLNSVGNVALPGGGTTPTGVLTNDGSGRTLNNFNATTLTTITVGAGGGTIAATTSSTFTIAQLSGSGGIVINAGANKLTFGSTIGIDGLNKAGAVDISGSSNSGITAGSVDIVAGTLQNLGGGMSYNIGGGTGITRVFSGATFSSSATVLINTNLQIDAGATAYSTATTNQIAALSGSGNAVIGASVTDNNARALFVGANNLSTTFSGVLSQNTGTSNGSLVKTGTGTFTLAGAADTYRGTTIVNGGTLRVENAHGSAAARVDNYTVNVGAALGGSMANAATDRIFLASTKTVTLNGAAGAFNADPTQRATLAPGSGGLGQFNVDGGSVIFGGNSTLSIDTGLATSDLLSITNGGLSLATATDLLAVTASDAGTFTIAQWTGTRTSVFDNYSLNGSLVSGTFDGAGTTFTASSGMLTVFYDDTLDRIQLTVVPEPGALVSLAGGLGLLLGASRLRRRRW